MAAMPIVHQIENRSAILYSDITVTILGQSQDLGEMDSCSAVLISANDAKATDLNMITAGHCVHDTVEDAGEGVTMKIHPVLTRMQFFNGDEGRITSYRVDRYNDIAFLRVHTSRPHHEITTLGHPITRGQRMVVMGDPEDNYWSLQDAMSVQGAVYNNLYDPWRYTYALQCSSCGQGDSGAGVWNNQGHLVGIVVAGSTQETLMVPASRLRL